MQILFKGGDWNLDHICIWILHPSHHSHTFSCRALWLALNIQVTKLLYQKYKTDLLKERTFPCNVLWSPNVLSLFPKNRQGGVNCFNTVPWPKGQLCSWLLLPNPEFTLSHVSWALHLAKNTMISLHLTARVSDRLHCEIFGGWMCFLFTIYSFSSISDSVFMLCSTVLWTASETQSIIFIL